MQGLLLQDPAARPGSLQPLLTIPAVAKLLGVSRPTVYVLIETEGLPIIKFGRCVRIDPRSLDTWLISHEQEQGGFYVR